MVELLKHGFRTGHAWVTTIASLVALAFSGYNFSQLREEPQTTVALPLSLRTDSTGNKISLFLQPTIATRFDTEDAEMVTDVRLLLRPANAAAEPLFFWEQNVKWLAVRDPKSYTHVGVWWEFESDPAPFIVSQDAPQKPAMQFSALDWKPAPGRYDGILTIHRASTRAAIEKPFCLVMRAEDVKEVEKTDGWSGFRRGIPGRGQDGCYHWYGY